MSEDAIKIFYSYSRKDLDLRNTLEDHLSALREAGKIRTWHDLELEAGTEWEPAILEKLDTADIILLLVSRNFIASKYCYGTELKRAIARHDAGTARVIPVILRHCDWNHDYVPFSKLNVLPTHAKPITSWADPDEAFAIVAQEIRETVTQIEAKKLAVRQAVERKQQQLLAQKAAAERAKQERLQREQQQAEEQERQRQAEILKQQAAERQRQRQQELAQQIAEVQAERERLQQEVEAAERQRQQKLAQQEAAERAERERLQREQQRQEEQKAKVYRFVQSVTEQKQSIDLIQAKPIIKLASERGVDYSRLRDLLKAGKWQEADQETADRMCEVMGRQQEGWLRIKDIEKFPCTDLRTIDQLWVKSSKGHFGFSVQKQIWQACGSPTDYGKNWDRFCDRVGWKVNGSYVNYNDLKFNPTTSFKGELPLRLVRLRLVFFWSLDVGVLFSRAGTCRL